MDEIPKITVYVDKRATVCGHKGEVNETGLCMKCIRKKLEADWRAQRQARHDNLAR